jgi:Na+-transporting NADH:ubiquinone oxidoreductase subunit C
VFDVNKNGYTIIFATISCVFCSILLSGANVLLKERQDINKKIDEQRNVLMAAKLADSETTAESIATFFAASEGEKALVNGFMIKSATGEKDESVSVEAYLKKPKDYKDHSLVYECTLKGKESYILPIVGVGLWGKMYGFLALKPNGDEVLGISFYKHQETPGLGAKITDDWFKEQFEGKRLLEKEGDYDSYKGITVLKGFKVANLSEAEKPYAVDGISGATITSVGVMDIMKKDIREKYLPYFKLKNK